MHKYKIVSPLGKGSFGNVYKIKKYNALNKIDNEKKRNSKFLFISDPDNIYKSPYTSNYKSSYKSSYKSNYKPPYVSNYKSPYVSNYNSNYKSPYKSNNKSTNKLKDKYNSDNYLDKHIKKNNTPVIKNEEKYYAMKKIPLNKIIDKQDKVHLLNEIRILTHNDCPFLLSMVDLFQDISYICLVTKFVKYGDFYSVIKKRSKFFEEEQIWNYFIQTCLGLKYLHDNNIIHRDIKASNIFLHKRDRVIIGDFGICKLLKCTDDLTNTSIGTPYYMSPELFKHEEYSKKIDIWALGCFLFELMAFKPPFQGYSIRQLSSAVRKEKYCKNIDTLRYSKELRNIIKKILIKDMNSRPNIDNILDIADIRNKTDDILIKHNLKGYDYNDNDIYDFDLKFNNIDYFIWKDIVEKINKELTYKEKKKVKETKRNLLNKPTSNSNLDIIKEESIMLDVSNDVLKENNDVLKENNDVLKENNDVFKEEVDNINTFLCKEMLSKEQNLSKSKNILLKNGLNKKYSVLPEIKKKDYSSNINNNYKKNKKNYKNNYKNNNIYNNIYNNRYNCNYKYNFNSRFGNRYVNSRNYDLNISRYENNKKITKNKYNQERYDIKNKNSNTNFKNFY